MTIERNAWGFSIFADDFRQEIGGKVSLMGIYQIDMLFKNEFPIIIPKFVIFVKYLEVKDTFSDDLNLIVTAPWSENPIVDIKLPRGDLDFKESYPNDDADSERLYNITMPIVLSPFNVSSEGFVKVRMKCGQTTTRLGRLMIRKVKEGEEVQFSS